MRDFLDGASVRVRSGHIDGKLKDFMLWCEAYGLVWADGSRPTLWPVNPSNRFIAVDRITGALIASSCPTGGGYKDLEEVRPLRHNLGQFIRGDFLMHVRRNEIGEFLDTCTKNRLLWVGGMPPRVGMKGVKAPKEGLVFAARGEKENNPRIYIVRPDFCSGPVKRIVDFHYIPRYFELPHTSTLDSAKRIEKAARTIIRNAIAEIDAEPPTKSENLHPNVAPESNTILVTSNAGSPVTMARLGCCEGRIKRVETRCGREDRFKFATGAMVALAELFGREAWREGAAEVNRMFARREAAKHKPDELQPFVR